MTRSTKGRDKLKAMIDIKYEELDKKDIGNDIELAKKYSMNMQTNFRNWHSIHDHPEA